MQNKKLVGDLNSQKLKIVNRIRDEGIFRSYFRSSLFSFCRTEILYWKGATHVCEMYLVKTFRTKLLFFFSKYLYIAAIAERPFAREYIGTLGREQTQVMSDGREKRNTDSNRKKPSCSHPLWERLSQRYFVTLVQPRHCGLPLHGSDTEGCIACLWEKIWYFFSADKGHLFTCTLAVRETCNSRIGL